MSILQTQGEALAQAVGVIGCRIPGGCPGYRHPGTQGLCVSVVSALCLFVRDTKNTQEFLLNDTYL